VRCLISEPDALAASALVTGASGCSPPVFQNEVLANDLEQDCEPGGVPPPTLFGVAGEVEAQ
jgi:hypothetical protein